MTFILQMGKGIKMKKRQSGKTTTEFMMGRYGYDLLSRDLIVLSMVLMLLSVFLNVRWVFLIAIIVLAMGYGRMFSKKITKRQQEFMKYRAFLGRFSKKYRQPQNKGTKEQPLKYASFEAYQQQDAGTTYSYYRCRKCGQTVRVPQGKGIVKITCPECGNSFVDRT